MKRRFILMAVILCGALTSAFAQEQDTTLYEFRPHWYLSGAFGYQYTIGETTDASALSYMNAQIAVGYNFTPVWGLRLAINGWQSRAAYVPTPDLEEKGAPSKQWKWYYVAPSLDVTMDLVNLIGGYKYDRIVSAGPLAGVGANIFFHNNEATQARQDLNDAIPGLGNAIMPGNDSYNTYWEGCKASPLGKVGVFIDFRITDKFRLGVEGSANFLMDKYNSKYAHNPDWYLNALVTARYNFGGTYNEKKVKKDELLPCKQQPDTVVQLDTVYVEKEVVDTLAIITAAQNSGNGTAYLAMRDSLRTEIFFPISSNKVSVREAVKLRHILDFMNKYPNSKVLVTGYADKGTGTAKYNQMISEKRAQVVKEYLISQGIAEDRITVKGLGDTVQPYDKKGDSPELNRVSICVIE